MDIWKEFGDKLMNFIGQQTIFGGFRPYDTHILSPRRRGNGFVPQPTSIDKCGVVQKIVVMIVT